MQNVLPAWLDVELLKLVLGAATPITVLIAGWMLKRREQLNAELIKKRICIYEEVAPLANDILCFYGAVGRWRDLDPASIIECKRNIDRIMHVYRHFWSGEVWRAHKAFTAACFVEYAGGAGRPARLKLDVAHMRRDMGDGWREEWLAQLAEGSHSITNVRRAYEAWMISFAHDIGVRDA